MTIAPKNLIINLLGLALLITSLGCGGSPTNTDLNPTASYKIFGFMVNDQNTDSSWVRIKMIKDSALNTTAVISFDGDTLGFADSTYQIGFSLDSALEIGAASLQIDDSTLLSVALPQTMVDTFSLSNVVPSRREKLTSETVQLEWTGAANAAGYVIAAVKAGAAYTGTGYSQYGTGLTTSATFNNEAFTIGNVLNNQVDIGLYYLYVFAFNGTPDSALSASFLPVPLPSQLNNNINISPAHLTGRFGSITVIHHDSMMVLAE